MKRKLPIILFFLVTILSSKISFGQVLFFVTDPPSVAGTYDFSYIETANGWNLEMDTVFVEEQLVIVHDGTADDTLGCLPLINGAQLAGKIAVVYRGVCEFGTKALNAQNAGAVGVIIVNHTPGAGVIGMLAGVDGGSVTIPVVMVSYETGQLLRPHIDAGTASAIIGNKTGAFANDLGAFRADIVIPNAWAIPSAMATNASTFEIPAGAWVTNYGTNNQSGVTLSATITYGGNTIYNQTSAAVTINTGDSLFITLPTFSQSSYADGLYRLDYTISSTNPDDFPLDNTIGTNFWIQPDFYSKSRWDTTNAGAYIPMTTNFYRTGDVVDEFTWCTVLDHPNAANMTAYGVSFSTTAAATSSLAGKSMEVLLFEWNDVITTTLDFNNVSLVTSEFYDYIDNSLSGIMVTQMFPQPVQLSNTRYLACVQTFDQDVFIGADEMIDYEAAWDAYNSGANFEDLSVFFPIRNTTGGVDTWNGVGFGSEPVPAIILHVSPALLPTGIHETVSNNVLVPYPNPTSEYVNVPFAKEYSGTVVINVHDIAGRIVKSENLTMNNSANFRIDTRNLVNGIYQVNLKFNDNSVSNFPVVIAK